ncbi:MAG: TRZ/ATZ family hydrolase [Thiobacillaceae bacterium]
MPQPIDTLILPRWLVPVEPAGTLADHALAVHRGAILDMLPAAEACTRYSAQEIISLPNHALIPGLVNLHTHAAMALLRGFADDLPLMDWLQHFIWPAEQAHVSGRFVKDGSLLACAEMLKGGITCFNDMYFFPDATAEASLESGMRASIGMIAMDLPTPYASDGSDYLAKGLACRDRFKGEPGLSFCFAPHAPYTVGDETFSQIATLAEQIGAPIHCHLHETRDELAQSEARHDVRPLERLARLGLLGPGFIGVHAIHLTEPEIGTLVRYGCHVAHCPASNLKLASGLAPIGKLLEAGINIGLGTDGAASNNRLDLFAEMRLAALLTKGVSNNAAALPAFDALKAATLNGAQALGLDDRIGSLTPGKRADMVAVDLSRPELQPLFDPVSHLVYVAGREDVSHVWVDGQLKVDNGKLIHFDLADLMARASYWSNKLLAPNIK